jgi:hypothetical protein
MQLSAPRPVDPLEKLELPSENPVQIAYNGDIVPRLENSDPEARERVEDAIQFAKWMRPNHPEVEVLVTSGPVIRLVGEEGGHSFRIDASHGCFCFSVNRSSHVTIEKVQDRIPVGRKLLTAWETLIAHLPNGFVIYGPDINPESEDFAIREKLLLGLGFGATEENGDRFGIVHEGKLAPLTGSEFAAMVGEDGVAGLFNQRFMVEEIFWPVGD